MNLRESASPNRKLRLMIPITVPNVVYGNHRETTRTIPTHPNDCVNRLPIQAIVKIGSAPPVANMIVKRIEPTIPPRKLRRPPKNSVNPPPRIFPTA